MHLVSVLVIHWAVCAPPPLHKELQYMKLQVEIYLPCEELNSTLSHCEPLLQIVVLSGSVVFPVSHGSTAGLLVWSGLCVMQLAVNS